MTNERLYYLIDRMMHGNATEEEEVEYLRWRDENIPKKNPAEPGRSLSDDLNIVRSKIVPPALKVVRIRRRILFAAAVLGFIFSTALYFQSGNHEPSPSTMASNNSAEKSPSSENWMVLVQNSDRDGQYTLPDQSVVHLKAGSTLIWNQRLFQEKKARVIRLEGNGFFEVKRNTNLPFLVQSNLLNIRALGTSFRVISIPEESSIQLKSGQVAVWERNEINVKAEKNKEETFKYKSGFVPDVNEVSFSIPDAQRVLYLIPGESVRKTSQESMAKMTMSKKQRKKESTTSLNASDFSLQQEIQLEGASMDVLITAINTALGETVLSLRGNASDYAFSGRFSKGENLDKILQKIKVLYPVEIEKSKTQIIIKLL